MKKSYWVVLALTACLALGASPLLAGQTKLLSETVCGPGLTESHFDLPGTPDSVSIKVQNGGENGETRVSSAEVLVNGKAVFTQKDFNQNVASLVSNLPKEELQARNGLTVTVNGKKTATLKVTILGEYPDAPPPAEPQLQAWYLDRDRDGYGFGSPIFLPVGAPPPPGTYTLRGGDCNDANPGVYPGNGCP